MAALKALRHPKTLPANREAARHSKNNFSSEL
jgi:hypothetical protein